MARNISTASLAKLATNNGTEPVCLVEIGWVDDEHTVLYGDRAYADEPSIDGRIQNITTINDTLNFSKNGTAQSVTVVLNDTDGRIKNIFNSVDIHRKTVWVYQWFTGIPLSDKFLIFRGVIATPIAWKEGERTIQFDVISKLDDFEVGFSAEEGNFPTLPDALIDKPWPLIFGTVSKVPCLILDDIPQGGSGRRRGSGADSVTKDPTGIHDPAIDKFNEDINNQFGYQMQLALAYFLRYLGAALAALDANEDAKFIAQFSSPSTGDQAKDLNTQITNLKSARTTFSSLAKQFLAAGNKALKTAGGIQQRFQKLEQTLFNQKQHEKKSIGVTNGSNFPQAQLVSLNIGGAIHTGYFSGDIFTIVDAQHPQGAVYNSLVLGDPSTRDLEPVITRSNFFFADAGTPIRIAQNSFGGVNEVLSPVRYIVSAGINVTILALYAWQTDGVTGFKYFNAVPSTYWESFTFLPNDPNGFGPMPVTAVLLPQPLSTLNDSEGFSLGYEDELFATVTSPIGPGVVDIMRFIINTYTDYDIDETSFAAVAIDLQNTPMNFALLNRPNAIKVLQDIAYQARCIIYSKDDVFYLKFLPSQGPPTATISEADILFNSLEVTTTETEDLITKYVAIWKPDYTYTRDGNFTNQIPDYKVVLRFNTDPYGLHEQDFQYFAYNQQVLVATAATFWMIRMANIFKIVKMTVPLTKLNIESLDYVTLNFSHPFIANGPVVGFVEEAVFNPDEYSVNLTIWTPVRIGEMTPYAFAYPGDLTEFDFWPTIVDQNEGRLANTQVTQPKTLNPFTGDQGNGGSVTYQDRPQTWGDPGVVEVQAPPLITNIDSTAIVPVGKPPGVDNYQFDRTVVKPEPIVPPIPGTWPGRVLGPGDDPTTYVVGVYDTGMDNGYNVVKNVRQIDIASDDVIDKDTYCTVSLLVWQDDTGTYFMEYVMQVPVWAGTPEVL